MLPFLILLASAPDPTIPAGFVNTTEQALWRLGPPDMNSPDWEVTAVGNKVRVETRVKAVVRMAHEERALERALHPMARRSNSPLSIQKYRQALGGPVSRGMSKCPKDG